MSIKINYSGSIAKLTDAIQQANMIMGNDDFYNLIASKSTPFDDSSPKDLSPRIVSDKFRLLNLTLTLDTYETNSSIGGKFWTKYPGKIFANTNALPLRSASAIAAMLIHECVHALSYSLKNEVPTIRFSHDDQRPKYNQDTAPYWIQRKVLEVFNPEIAEQDTLEVELVTNSDASEFNKINPEQIEEFRRSLKEYIRSYKEKRLRNKLGAVSIHLTTVACSVGTTILVGMKELPGWQITLSSSVIALTAIDKFFDYKILWVEYNGCITTLKTIETKLNFIVSAGLENIQPEVFNELFNKFERTVENLKDTYLNTRKAND